ncbi:MAG: DUF2442 domain-containing protein [Bacteroidota bacterium]
MNSSKHGKDILINNTVTNITNIGFWVLVNNKEYFIAFEHYPCFRGATIEQITSFKMLSPDQLHWQSLDCDIELKALREPDNYPLSFKK